MKKYRIITIISSLLMMVMVIITFFALNFGQNSVSELGFEKSSGNYKSSQKEIANATADPSEYVFMSDLYTYNNNTLVETSAAAAANIENKIIAIVSAEDLYAFSYLANPNKNSDFARFLTYDYELLTNIDYDAYFSSSSSNGTKFFFPIGWNSNNDGFSGSFNGNGFEIVGLRFDRITTSEATQTYSNDDAGKNIVYFSMFSQVETSGTITNFGLVEARIAISQTIGNMSNSGGVSPLVGLNKGTISYCYVKDLRDISQTASSDAEKSYNEAGITAMGGYHVSGMVVENRGTISNCYVAYNIVSNYTVTDLIDFVEMILFNYGTISNLYFYNSTIVSYEKTTANNISSGATISYDQRIGLNYHWPNHYGFRAITLDDLNSKVKASDSTWIDSSHYGDLSSYVSIETPIRRYLSLKENTTDTLLINNVSDYLFMYLLFNTNVKMASGLVKYEITDDINLTGIPSSLYSYDGNISSTIYGREFDNPTTESTALLVDNNLSPYPTIYNATTTNYQKIEGVDSYGVFPYLTGTVEKLNFAYTSTISFAPTASSNIKSFGVVSGFVDGGNINNVNTFADIAFTDNIGQYFVGGIVGVLSGKGVISNVTTSGANKTLTNTASASSSFDTGDFIYGNAIGGVVGYITDSYGSITNCYNTYSITAGLGNTNGNANYAIGGIMGIGYTFTANNLENIGDISVNSSTYTSSLYVAGIIGRHLGVQSQITNFNNQGDISLNRGSNIVETYVSGIENVDIKTQNNHEITNSIPSKHRISGNYVFYASDLSNRANVSITTNAQTNLYFTGALNVKSSNGFKSTISGIYNLAYRTKLTSGNQSTTTTLGSINLTAGVINSYAPVLNNVGGTSNSILNVSKIYNFRNIVIDISSAISSATTFNYTGCALGEYINYEDVRNEGTLNVNLAAGISATSTLKVSGLFETLSNGCKSKNLYNGGDITVNEPNNSASDKYLNMYLSGICYQNLSVDSSNEQNPLNANFDDSLIGTMDSIINNGNITVSSYYLQKNTAINVSPTSTPHYKSNIYVGGITYTNSGIISTAFNLGKIDIAVYSSEVKRYEVGGVSCLMNGQYAQIRDSANNGDIYVIDLGGKVSQINSIVNVGGIVARNTGTTTNNSQIIAFTINYGTIIGFLARDNMTTTTYGNAHSIASGIIGTGFCNLINIVNYGNVYGKECVAGIMGIVQLGLFNNNYTSTIANTLNYGQVKIIPPYDNLQQWATYNVIISLDTVKSNDYSMMYTHAGSICSIFDFSNRNNVTIRYLINLFNGELTVFSSLNSPTVAPDVSTFITTKSATDSFGGESNKIPYAPLSTVEDDNNNIGVFSSEFSFRKAVNGIGLDSNYITDSYISNFFQFVKFDKVNQELLETIGWRTIAYANAAEDLVKNIEALKILVDKAGSSATSLLSDAFENDSWISNCNMDILDSLIEASFDSGLLDSSISTILDYILFDTTATSSYTLAIRKNIVEKILEYYEKQGNVDYYEILQTMLYDTLLAKVISENDANYTAVKDKIEEVLSESTDLETILNSYIEALESDDSIINGLFVGSDISYYETAKINLVTTLLEGYDDSTLESLYITLNLTPADEDSSLKYKLYLQQHQDEAANIYSHLILNNSLSTNSEYLNWTNQYLDKYNVSSMIDSSETTGTVDEFGNITDLTGYKYSPVTTNNEYNSSDSQKKTIRQFESANITSLDITPTKDYRNLWNIIKTDSGIQNYIAENYFTTVKNPTTDLDESGIIAKATEYTNSYQTNDRTMSDYGMVYNYDSETNGKSFYVTDIAGNKYYGGVDYGYDDNTLVNYYGGSSYGKSYPIRNRFIYTPDNYVTYRTNYLGPYATKTGIVYDQKVSTNNGGTFFSGNRYGYKKGANLAATDESNQTARGTVPVFISVNEDLTTNMIASSGTNASDRTIYKYHWQNSRYGGSENSQDYMWKHENFVTLAPGNTLGYIYNNYNSGTYMCDYYNFDPNYVPTIDYDLSVDNTLPNGQNVKLVNQTGSLHTYKEYYLTGYCTAAIITGLYYTYSSWPNGGVKCVSLLSKRDGTYAWNKVSNHTNLYFGVHTTDYICYKIEDLVKLDGYKTKGFNSSISNNNDQDETNIIGAIVEKLLTDNKKLVLKAIANYSVDNDFTVSDANTLKLLLTSVGDTNFAKQSIIESIPTIRNMNYSGLQTISTYLESLNINFTSYSDKLIISTVNNKLNFKNLLQATLDNYSKKCSDYSDYNTYDRNDINNFIYKYLAYLYANDSSITASQIDNILASTSDAELQKLEDLLVHIKNTVISYDDAEYVYNDVFTIYDVILYSKDYVDYVTDGYDRNYNAVMVADDMSEMEFSTSNYQYGYKLEVTYKGTVDLDGLSSHTNPTVDTYTFTGLSRNSSYTLLFSQGTEIYDVKLKNTDYNGYESSHTDLTPATSPFASVSGTSQIANVNFVLDGDDGKHTYLYGHYYSNLWKYSRRDSVPTASEMYILISKGSNISYNSINISFKTLSYYNPNIYSPSTVELYYNNNGSQATNSSHNGTINLTSTNNGTVTGNGRTFYQTTYTVALSSTVLNILSNSNLYLTLYIAKPEASDNNVAFSVNDFIITYDFDFNNNGEDNTNSNVVFNQNLFNSYYSDTIKSSYTITNSNDHCGVAISGGSSISQDLTFSTNSPTTVNSTNSKQINASLLFEPWYYASISVPESLYSQIDLGSLDFGGDSIKQHFIDGKYDVSDLAKYLVKDIFTNITVNEFFSIANESFIEIHATGQGNIYVYDGEDIELQQIAVDTQSDEYKYYEIIVASNSYKLVCDNGVSFDLALVVPTNVQLDYSVSAGIDTLKAVSGSDERVLISLDYSTLSDPLSTGASTPTQNNINIVGTTYLAAFNAAFSTNYDNYSLFYNIYPYKRVTNTTKTPVELRNDDVFNTIITLMATIHQDTDDSSYYSIFKDSTFTDENLIDIIKLVSIADNVGANSAYRKLVDGLNSSYYEELIRSFDINEVKINIGKKIYNLSTNDSNLAKYVYAAYLGNDYVNKINLYTTTIMYSLLGSFNAPDDNPDLGTGGYQFITSNTTVDADKVTALISYLSNSSNLNIDGYGIFALSSSQGIGYGIFIPDNMTLSSLDSYYEYDEYIGAYKIITTKSSDWRGGDVPSEGLEGTVDYAFYYDMKQLKKSISTVIFKLDLEPNMPKNPIVLHSSESQIDLDNKVITYYVPKSFITAIEDKTQTSTISIDDVPIIANNAIYSTKTYSDGAISYVDNGETISLYGRIYNPSNLTIAIEDAIKVTAEDTTIVSSYDVVFKGIDISFEIDYETDTTNHNEIVVYNNELDASSATVDYTGGIVLVNVNSPVDNEKSPLPESFDLSQFVYLVKYENDQESTTKLTSDAFIISVKDGNAIIDSNGDTAIQLEILSSLASGTYHLYVDIYGYTDYVILEKNASTLCNIETFNYDGTDYHDQFSLTNGSYQYTTYVDYGIAYDYEELLNHTYLEELKISDNASLDITVEKNNPSANGQMTYTVTYLVTAEDRIHSKTYKHKLKEKNPFKNYQNNAEQDTTYSFTTIYKDGSSVGSYNFDNNVQVVVIDQVGNIVAIITPTVSDNLVQSATAKDKNGTTLNVVVEATKLDITITHNSASVCKLNNILITDNVIVAADAYYGANNTLGSIVSKDSSNNLYVSFARGSEPTYRIKFVISNFYSEFEGNGNDDIEFEVEDVTNYNINDVQATLDKGTAGFFATVSNDMDAGTYSFEYKYSHSGVWSEDTEYIREYTFPKLVVTKTYSKEALINAITFLESFKVIGNTATAVLPGLDGVMIPSQQDDSLDSYNQYDILYNNVFADTFNRPILVDDDGTLTYNTNTSATVSGHTYNYGDANDYRDYYVVGTVSGADLQEYAPIFEIEENAMIFKSTSLYKILNYGQENGQTETDKDILEHHSNSTFTYNNETINDINFIYVPFYSGNEDTATNQVVYLVAIDARGYWTGIYSTNTKGGSPLLDVTTYNVDTIKAMSYSAGFNISGTTYHVSKYAGTTSVANNKSIYMDFIGNPLENHFNYISYLVVSENYLKNTPTSGENTGTAKYFHIALIDTSNNIYFNVSIYTPRTGFNYDNLYLTISENIYINNSKYTKSISAYANDTNTYVTDSEAKTYNMKKFNLVENLQILPSGYFYFYMDLPEGYKATYVITNGKTNQINTASATFAGENEGAYLAPNSIVTQTIKVAIIIEAASTQDSSLWAVKTSDTFTRQITQVSWDSVVSDEHPDY